MNGCIVIKYDTNCNQYVYQYNATNYEELKPKGLTFQEVMEKSADVMNNDPVGNLRYVGATPDNYVKFNNELWIIIGVFDGQAKIIRNECYDENLFWNDGSTGSLTNNWETASLKSLLNDGDTSFLKTIETNDSTSYGYIDLYHLWNVGAVSSQDYLTRSDFYYAERSETPAGSEGSKPTWTGAVGLMYPSDYGYASKGATEICDSTVMYNWDVGDYKTECAKNSWLYENDHSQYTITTHGLYTGTVFVVSGMVDGISVNYYSLSAHPVLYLKSNVKIVGGKGTYDEPYELGI